MSPVVVGRNCPKGPADIILDFYKKRWIMASYSNEEKLKAVELYIRNDKRTIQTIRELGYPNRGKPVAFLLRILSFSNYKTSSMLWSGEIVASRMRCNASS